MSYKSCMHQCQYNWCQWASECTRTCFSTCSACQPCTCLMRFSLKCAASVGVKEHVTLPGAAPVGTEPGGIAPLTTPGPWPPPPPPLLLLLLLPTWFEPGDGLLWLLEARQTGQHFDIWVVKCMHAQRVLKQTAPLPFHHILTLK